MMDNILKYKEYSAVVNYSQEDNILYGKILGISDLVTFESDSLTEIKKEFENAVDDYLNYCAAIGKKPEKEYKGSFNVRVAPDVHEKLAISAAHHGVSLNREVEVALIAHLSNISNDKFGAKLDDIQKLTEESIEIQQYTAKVTQDMWGRINSTTYERVGTYDEN